MFYGVLLSGEKDHMTAVTYRAKVREAESPDWDGPLARNIMHQSKWPQKIANTIRTSNIHAMAVAAPHCYWKPGHLSHCKFCGKNDPFISACLHGEWFAAFCSIVAVGVRPSRHLTRWRAIEIHALGHTRDWTLAMWSGCGLFCCFSALSWVT